LFLFTVGVFVVAVVALVQVVQRGPLVAGERQEAPPAAPSAQEPVAAWLSALRRDEPAWLGKRVRFALQLHGLVPDWNPFLSRFGPAQWLAVSAWPDEAFLWDQPAFDDPCPTLFARRGGPLEEGLRGAAQFDRFEAVGVVREAFRGEPWIEIQSLTPLEGSVGDGTILHVARARDFVLQGQWELALQQFERAKAAPLPAHALAEIDRQVVLCERMRDEEAARKRR
jgi:hypothetical protein